jgi:pimeloyl-ACP methyl ester carboxylesterase
MPWIVSTGVLAGVLVLLLVPIVLLFQRKIRQASIAANLKIERPRGIVEQGYVSIGGCDQWISIRGEDENNPALLILHGGPGCSYSIFTPHLRAWEKHFTIVQWDQRGSGRTLAHRGKRRSGKISFEQLTRDAIEVAEYVRTRLGKDRIFLIASSLGSTFGIRVARVRPDLLYAYIGTDQNVGMGRASDENHQAILERLRALRLSKGVKTLERIGSDPARWSADDFEAVARWTMKSDPEGFKRTMKLLKDAVWYAPRWKLRDIRTFVAGMRYSLEQLLPEITQYDAWKEGTHFQIPFFIFQGEADVLTSPKLAQSYFEDVTAPVERFVLIADAGHFAAFMQPDQFLCQLFLHVRPLAEFPCPAVTA